MNAPTGPRNPPGANDGLRNTFNAALSVLLGIFGLTTLVTGIISAIAASKSHGHEPTTIATIDLGRDMASANMAMDPDSIWGPKKGGRFNMPSELHINSEGCSGYYFISYTVLLFLAFVAIAVFLANFARLRSQYTGRYVFRFSATLVFILALPYLFPGCPRPGYFGIQGLAQWFMFANLIVGIAVVLLSATAAVPCEEGMAPTPSPQGAPMNTAPPSKNPSTAQAFAV